MLKPWMLETDRLYLLTYAEKRERWQIESEVKRKAYSEWRSETFLGKRVTAYSVSGEYFLGSGKCVGFAENLHAVIENESGKRFEVPAICLKLVEADIEARNDSIQRRPSNGLQEVGGTT